MGIEQIISSILEKSIVGAVAFFAMWLVYRIEEHRVQEHKDTIDLLRSLLDGKKPPPPSSIH